MKVLYATNNPAKINYYSKALKELGIELVTSKELGINLNVEENGKTPTENAIIKAKAYNEQTGMITIAGDDGFFINGLKDEDQPNTNVRRVGNKVLNDGEMLEYYKKIAKSLGGKTDCFWLHAMAICSGDQTKSYEVKSRKILTDMQSSKINEGFPLDSIIMAEEFGKYQSELTDEELNISRINSKGELLGFIKNTIEDLENVK